MAQQGRDGLGNPIKPPKLDSSGRYTGVRVGAGNVKKPSRTYTMGEMYPNLKGAPIGAVAAIVGNKNVKTGEEGLLTAEEYARLLHDAQTTAAAANTPQKTGTGAGKKNKVVKPNYTAMYDALKKLSELQQGTINTGAQSLTALLNSQVNPYEGLQAQSAQVQPELQTLLQSQGVNTNPLGQFAAALNTQNAGQTTAFQNLINQMSGMYNANRTGQIGDVEANRINMLNQLQGNVLGVGANLIGKNENNRAAIVKLLLSALGNQAG